MLLDQKTNKSTATPAHPGAMIALCEIEQSGLQRKITSGDASKTRRAWISAKLPIGSFPAAAVQKVLSAPRIERFRNAESGRADVKHGARVRLRLGTVWELLGLRQNRKAEKQDCYNRASHKASFAGFVVSALQVVRHLGGALFCGEKRLSYDTRAAVVPFLVLWFFLIPSAFAQTPTVVTGTVLDTNGLPYVNAKVAAQLVGVPPTQTATILVNGIPVQIGGQQNANANSSGVFSMNLFCNSAGGGCSAISPPGTQWQITVNTEGERPPFGTGSQTCTATVTISGSSQDLSASFNACPALTKNIPSGAGGSAGQVQVNNPGSPGALAGAGCETFTNKDTGPVNVNCDWHSKGLNPYVDATRYGVRPVNPLAVPAVAGITATCTGGQPTVSISSASTFQNNDGAVVQGCGAANGLGTVSAPTVTPFNARGPLMSGDGVAAPAGATTYNYKVFACDVGGGCTAPSAVGSTSTGAASLGVQNVIGFSGSRSNDTWTYTLGSQPAFSAGTVVDVDTPTAGVGDADFQGWFLSASVTGTGFTVSTAPSDARNGSRTASTGTYTVHFWNYNKVTWAAATGSPFRYFVCSDRASPGTYHVLGPAIRPVNPKQSGFNVDPLELEFDDFGATLSAASASVIPWYVSDANCTGSATNDNWVTTISSGATTTTLTMSTNAPNSGGPGATILFDSTINGTAAVTAAGSAPVEFPFSAAGLSYVFNAVWDISDSNPTLMLPNGLVVNDTILVANGSSGGGKWYGNRIPAAVANGGGGQFQGNPIITTKGLPGVFAVNGQSFNAEDLTFIGPANGVTFMQDGGGGGLGTNFTRDIFISGSPTSSTDYLGIAFLCRGVPGGGCIASFQARTYMNAGTSSMNGVTSAPSFFCDNCATAKFDEWMSVGRGLVVSQTAGLRIGYSHFNGAGTPPVWVTCTHATNCFTDVVLGDEGGMILDTVGQPEVVSLPAAGTITTNAWVQNISGPSSAIPIVSGQRLQSLTVIGTATAAQTGQNRDACNYVQGAFIDGVYVGNGSAGTNSINYCQTGLFVGSTYAMGVLDTRMSAPTAGAPTAGGSVPNGNHSYQIVPVWQNNGEGTISAVSNTVSAGAGNNTVPLTWTPVAGNCLGYNIYRDGLLMFNLRGANPNVLGCGTASASDTLASAGGGTPSVGPFGGPTMLMSGTKGIAAPLVQAPNLVSNGSACTNAELALSAGWQSTGSATVTAAAGLNQTCSWTITTGTTTAPNPTVTDTLVNALPSASTVCEMNIHGGTHTAAAGEGFQQTTLSATAPVFTFNGTPTAGGTTYFVTRRCGP